MLTRHCMFLFVAFQCMIGWGCRSLSEYDIAAREMRLQEDSIYSLRDQLEVLRGQLESCRRENDSIKRAAANGASSPTELQTDADSGGFDNPGDFAPTFPPSEKTPGPASDKEFDNSLEVPDVELGDPVSPEGLGVRRRLPKGFQNLNAGRFLLAADGTKRISQIKLNHLLTGGYDFDQTPGDEGVQVVLEQRDRAGSLVHANGEVLIRLIDPTKKGIDSLVARWAFSADELTSRFRNDAFGRGLHFRIPWPNQPPSQQELELVVDFRQTGGKRLTTRQNIRIDTQSNPKKSGSTTELAANPDTGRSLNASRNEAGDASSNPAIGSRIETARRRSQWRPYR